MFKVETRKSENNYANYEYLFTHHPIYGAVQFNKLTC